MRKAYSGKKREGGASTGKRSSGKKNDSEKSFRGKGTSKSGFKGKSSRSSSSGFSDEGSSRPRKSGDFGEKPERSSAAKKDFSKSKEDRPARSGAAKKPYRSKDEDRPGFGDKSRSTAKRSFDKGGSGPRKSSAFKGKQEKSFGTSPGEGRFTKSKPRSTDGFWEKHAVGQPYDDTNENDNFSGRASERDFKPARRNSNKGKSEREGGAGGPSGERKFSKTGGKFSGGEKRIGRGETSRSPKSYGSRTRSGEGKFKDAPVKKTYSKPRTQASDDGKIRLNKFIANTGICSRREADELITAGAVSVNGEVITEMGFKISPTDEIKYGGATLRKERMVYVLLNKPKDFITTTDDPENRRTVMQLVKEACKERIYPVGRLDRETSGVLLLTNDGELTKRLTHPSFEVKKIYHVTLDKNVKLVDLKKIAEGFELEDGFVKADEISYVGDSKKDVGIEIHSGRNRIIRRIFESLDYSVMKLDRVYFGGLTKKDLPRGRWRMLSEIEMNMLKMITGKKRSHSSSEI